MKQTLFEQILEVVEKYNSYSSLKDVTTTIYKSKADQTEVITEADFLTAFKSGKSINDFEEVTEVVSPKAELKALIFGDKAITTLYDLQIFVQACELATGKKVNFLSAAPAQKEKKEKKEKSGYAIKYAALKQAIKSAKDKGDTEKETLKIQEICQLMIDSDRTPKSTFGYMKVYNELKGNKKE